MFSVFTNSMSTPTKNVTMTAEFEGANTKVNSPVTSNYVGVKLPCPQRSHLLRLRLKVMENSDKIIQKLEHQLHGGLTRAMQPPVQPCAGVSSTLLNLPLLDSLLVPCPLYSMADLVLPQCSSS